MGGKMMSSLAQGATMSAIPGKFRTWFPKFLEAAGM